MHTTSFPIRLSPQDMMVPLTAILRINGRKETGSLSCVRKVDYYTQRNLSYWAVTEANICNTNINFMDSVTCNFSFIISFNGATMFVSMCHI